jgi:hypothetical protein
MKHKRLTAAVIAVAMIFTMVITASAAGKTVTYDDTETIKNYGATTTATSTFSITNVVSQSTIIFDSEVVDRYFPDGIENFHLSHLLGKEIPVFNCDSSVDITFIDGKFDTNSNKQAYGLDLRGAIWEVGGSLSNDNFSGESKFWNYNNIWAFMQDDYEPENPEISDSREEGKDSLFAFTHY